MQPTRVVSACRPAFSALLVCLGGVFAAPRISCCEDAETLLVKRLRESPGGFWESMVAMFMCLCDVESRKLQLLLTFAA